MYVCFILFILFILFQVLQNATRFALKLGEHTDGRDVKSNLKDNYSWKKKDFERAKAPGSKNYSQYATLHTEDWISFILFSKPFSELWRKERNNGHFPRTNFPQY